MKVKIGDRIFDSSTQPIMIIFEEGEKELISSMFTEDTKFCSFPDESNIAVIENFMKLEGEDENQLSLCIDQDVFKIPSSYPGD